MAEITNLATTGDFTTTVNGLTVKMKFTVGNETKKLMRIENGQILDSDDTLKGNFYTSEEAKPQLFVNGMPYADQAVILPALSQALTALTEALKAEAVETTEE